MTGYLASLDRQVLLQAALPAILVALALSLILRRLVLRWRPGLGAGLILLIGGLGGVFWAAGSGVDAWVRAHPAGAGGQALLDQGGPAMLPLALGGMIGAAMSRLHETLLAATAAALVWLLVIAPPVLKGWRAPR
jgi:hypothetical protein